MLTDDPSTTTRILIVEDEAIIAADLRRRLERLDYQVAGVADNGADALAMAAETRPSLVLMDIVIQGPLDGIATAAELSRRSDLPVVFLTAHSDAATIQRAKRVRPYGYLVKPFEDRDLHTTIETALYRHRTEAKARLLFQAMASATTGIAVADARHPEHRVILSNPALEQITGYSALELRQHGPCLLEGPQTDPAASAEVRRALREHRDCKISLVCHRKDGTPFWDDLTVSVVRNAVGEVTHFLFFHDDVTARKQAETALLQAQKMEAIGHLVGGVAHDFNNTLAVILSFAGFVRDDLPEHDPRREDVAEVLRAAEKAAALTRQLLTFARQQPAAKRPIDLGASVANVIRMLQRSVGERVAVEVAQGDRLAIVRMDPTQLDQVLLNLAVNARDAMPDGGRIRFTITHPAEPAGEFPAGGYVRLTASDTGHGMDRTTLARIFDPFFSTKPAGKGTGIGLTTCLAIVKDAGGTIRAASEPGKGATFTIDLPICEEPVEDLSEGVSADLRGAGERVLVVEDDPALRKAAVRILDSAGYQVSHARDGDEAVRWLDEAGANLDLIVTDVIMPGRGGRALVDYAKDHAPNTRVLLTSGYLDGEARLSDPFDALPLLWKPYTKAGLLHAARATLRGRPFDGAPPASQSPAARPGPRIVTDALHEPDEVERAGARASPRAEPAAAPGGPPPAARRAARDRVTAPEPTRDVLLVEDDEAQIEAYGRALRSAGFSVTSARSGEEAMGLLERRSFAAVVTDIGLSGADGLAVLRAARARDADVPVLLITGAPSIETATMAVQSRAVGYLAKPFSTDHLVREVQRAVEAGEVLHLQRKLLAARAGAEEFLLDVAGTRRSFKAALADLHMAFQPIVRSRDSSVFGFEALLRSNEPTLSSPQKVLAAAEALDRMDLVGLATRRSIAETMARHPERTESIFVNIHPSELRSSLLCAATEPLLPVAARVVLEVTERTSLAMGPQLNDEIRVLQEAGYRIAIDDLGEGYAGLSWLAHLKPDIAKIDMSLVRDVHRSPLKREIVGSLVNVCRRSGIIPVAEGVETQEEAQLLSALGCDLLQGYFFAKPGPAFPEVEGASPRAAPGRAGNG